MLSGEKLAVLLAALASFRLADCAGRQPVSHTFKLVGMRHEFTNPEDARGALVKNLGFFTGCQDIIVDSLDMDATVWHCDDFDRANTTGCPEEQIRRVYATIAKQGDKITRDYKRFMEEDFTRPRRTEMEWLGPCENLARKRTIDESLAGSVPAELGSTESTNISSGPSSPAEPVAETDAGATDAPAPSTTTEPPTTTAAISPPSTEALEPPTTEETTTPEDDNIDSNSTGIDPSVFTIFPPMDTGSLFDSSLGLGSIASSNVSNASSPAEPAPVSDAPASPTTAQPTTTTAQPTTTTTTTQPTTTTEPPATTTAVSASSTEAPQPATTERSTTAAEGSTTAASSTGVDTSEPSASPSADKSSSETNNSSISAERPTAAKDESHEPPYGKYIGFTAAFLVFIAYLVCSRSFRHQQMYELHND